RPGIQYDRVSILDQGCRCPTDARLLFLILLPLLLQRLIVDEVVKSHCTTVGAQEQVALLEVLQVLSNRHLGYAKVITQLGYGDVSPFVEHFERVLAPLCSVVLWLTVFHHTWVLDFGCPVGRTHVLPPI